LDSRPPLSGTDTVRDSAPPGAGLPPLPKAAPYVPPQVSTGRPITGPAAAVPRPATGPAATVADVRSDTSTISTGAPDESPGIPPTRPTTAAPTSSKAGTPRFTKKQLMIGGGGAAVLVIVVIAILASGGSKKPATALKPGGAGDNIEMDEVKIDPGPVI